MTLHIIHIRQQFKAIKSAINFNFTMGKSESKTEKHKTLLGRQFN